MNRYTINELFGKYPNDMIKKARNIKLLTHTDMDGSGAAVLMKYLNSLDPFFGLEIVRVHSNQTDAIIRQECLTNWDESYDLVLITDISCTRKTAQEIADSGHEDKVVLLDHHKSAIDEKLNQFGFCTIVAEGSAEDSVVRTSGKHPRNSSGTSLLYDFLVYEYEEIMDGNEHLKDLADSVAAYDTWDWQNVPDSLPHSQGFYRELNALFWLFGPNAWEKIHRKRSFTGERLLTKEDDILYLCDRDKCKDVCKDAIAGMQLFTAYYFVGYNIIDCGPDCEPKRSPVYKPYKTALCCASAYISDVYEAMKNAVPEAEIYLILRDNDSLSLRTDKDIDLSEIAKLAGGGGHSSAAGISLQREDIVKTALRITGGFVLE